MTHGFSPFCHLHIEANVLWRVKFRVIVARCLCIMKVRQCPMNKYYNQRYVQNYGRKGNFQSLVIEQVWNWYEVYTEYDKVVCDVVLICNKSVPHDCFVTMWRRDQTTYGVVVCSRTCKWSHNLHWHVNFVLLVDDVQSFKTTPDGKSQGLYNAKLINGGRPR